MMLMSQYEERMAKHEKKMAELDRLFEERDPKGARAVKIALYVIFTVVFIVSAIIVYRIVFVI